MSIIPHLRLTARILLGIMIIALIVMAVGLFILRARGDQLLSVTSSSMVPTLRPGDAVIVAPTHVGTLRAGEVISYHSPFNRRLVITHRLINTDKRSGYLQTQGDALKVPDQPWKANLMMGRVTANLPGYGRLLSFIRQPVMVGVIIFLPASWFIYEEWLRLIKLYSGPAYRALGYRP